MNKQARRLSAQGIRARMAWPLLAAVMGAAMGPAAAGPPVAAASPSFVFAFDALPLVEGLALLPEGSVVFDNSAGRIAVAIAVGNVDARSVSTFYADTAPQLGWRMTEPGRFVRDGEVLKIDVAPPKPLYPQSTVRFLLVPE